MRKSSSYDEMGVRKQFDRIYKLALKGEKIDYCRHIAYRQKHEVMLSELSEKGKCGHEWIATIKSRAISNTGCPYCSHNKILEGYNDLASQMPQVAAEWSEKNYPLMSNQVTVFANRKVWWRCSKCGYEWNTLISIRSGGSGCLCCSGLVLVKGVNDFATTHPQLAAEWSERFSGM